MVLKLISSIAISLVPYKSPCWSLVSFTPDVMQSVIRPPIALGHRYKRNYLFLTSLDNYEASVADSLYSTLQHSSTEIKSPFFLIVHHIECFHHCSIRWFAGYLWRFACGSPFLFFWSSHRPVLFARLPHDWWNIWKAFHLLYSIFNPTTEWSSRHTRLAICSCGHRRL